MQVVMRFHPSESERVVATRRTSTGVLDKELFVHMETLSGMFKPDGRSRTVCFKLPGQPEAFTSLQEIKNEGGSDSVPQVECDYRAIISKDEGRPFFRHYSSPTECPQ